MPNNKEQGNNKNAWRKTTMNTSKKQSSKNKKDEEMKSKHKKTMKALNDIEYTTHKGQY